MYTCDVCHKPALTHLTEITDGVRSNRHLCQDHTPEMPKGTAGSSMQERVVSMLMPLLKNSAAFIRQHGRLPISDGEYQQSLSTPDDTAPAAEITDPEIQ